MRKLRKRLAVVNETADVGDEELCRARRCCGVGSLLKLLLTKEKVLKLSVCIVVVAIVVFSLLRRLQILLNLRDQMSKLLQLLRFLVVVVLSVNWFERREELKLTNDEAESAIRKMIGAFREDVRMVVGKCSRVAASPFVSSPRD